MAKNPKPMRRWKRKATRSIQGKHKMKFTRCGKQIQVCFVLEFTMRRPRNLRIYR